MQHLAAVIFEIIDRLGNIRVRFTPAFPHFENFPCGEFPASLPHFLGGGEKKSRALGGALATPERKKVRRGFDRAFYIAARRDPHSTDYFARIGGIERCECLTIGPLVRVIVELRAYFLKCLAEALAVFPPRKVDEWLIANFSPVTAFGPRGGLSPSAWQFGRYRRLNQTANIFPIRIGLAQEGCVRSILH